MDAQNTLFEMWEAFFPYTREEDENNDAKTDVIKKYKNALGRSLAFSAGLIVGSQIKEEKILKLLRSRR